MTVENCGEDFLSRLASSNEDWDTEVDPEWGMQGDEGPQNDAFEVRSVCHMADVGGSGVCGCQLVAWKEEDPS